MGVTSLLVCGLGAAAGCVPLEELSSYRSAESSPPPLEPASAIPAGARIAPSTALPVSPPEELREAAAPELDAEGAPDAPETGALAADPAPEGAGGLAARSLPGTLRGESRQTLGVGEGERSFIAYVPPGLEPSVPAPVLIVAHGFEETAMDMVAITGFDAIAEREGFVVLYPEGQGLIPWNIGEGVCQGGARIVSSARGDDSAFLDAMLAFVAADRAIDAEHVFMSGLGSGAYLANDLGCRRSDIRAVVAHSGGSHPLTDCVTTSKPVLLLHGSDDTAVPLACSVEARARWAEHNGCTGEGEARSVRGGACELDGCSAGGQVMACTFDGMGRGWAGGAAQAAGFVEFESASELSWLFLKTFAW